LKTRIEKFKKQGGAICLDDLDENGEDWRD
jgi:hypothetical protein